MLVPFVVTDLTRMSGAAVCVAGYEYADARVGRCLRPFIQAFHPSESWLFSKTGIVRPFSMINIDVIRNRPEPPHTEDVQIDCRYRVLSPWLDEAQQVAILGATSTSCVADIFGASIHTENGWFIKLGEGERSIATIAPQMVENVLCSYQADRKKWDYRIAFMDETGTRYRLAVTDLAFRYYVDNLRETERLGSSELSHWMTSLLQNCDVLYLRIGLARRWEKFPDRCYLQITGVYPTPDYLDGRCFADFLPDELRPDRQAPLDLSDLPF